MGDFADAAEFPLASEPTTPETWDAGIGRVRQSLNGPWLIAYGFVVFSAVVASVWLHRLLSEDPILTNERALLPAHLVEGCLLIPFCLLTQAVFRWRFERHLLAGLRAPWPPIERSVGGVIAVLALASFGPFLPLAISKPSEVFAGEVPLAPLLWIVTADRSELAGELFLVLAFTCLNLLLVSAFLVEGRWIRGWKLVLIAPYRVIMTTLFVTTLPMGVGVLIGGTAFVAAGGRWESGAVPFASLALLSTCGWLVAEAAFTVFRSGITLFVYLEIRMRWEGLDAEWMARRAGLIRWSNDRSASGGGPAA